MAVRIIPNSVGLYVPHWPVVVPPVVEGHRERHQGFFQGLLPRLRPGVPVMNFRLLEEVRIYGNVRFHADRGDSAEGWRVGLIQAAWYLENWAYYRGERHTDGSVLVRRDVQPPRGCRDCRSDTLVSNIFYDTVLAEIRLTSLSERNLVTLIDRPRSQYLATTVNTLTGELNYLNEAARETHFCTVLSVRDPNGDFHHQKHVYWGLRWHATFHARIFDESSAQGLPTFMSRCNRAGSTDVCRRSYPMDRLTRCSARDSPTC